VHGGTFPSALSIAHRFDGRSWRDELCAAGFHVWGLDFLGFGGSDRYRQWPSLQRRTRRSGGRRKPPGRSRARRVSSSTGWRCRGCRSSPIPGARSSPAASPAHGRSWSIAWCSSARSPGGRKRPSRFPAWRPVSLADQWRRFTAEVPKGEQPVLSRRHFEEWGERYLDTDPDSRSRLPVSVKTPCGAWQDIAAAHAGDLGYDPRLVQAPVVLIRGEWDVWATDADARWLFDNLTAAPLKRDVKIGRATHLIHLEEGRLALYREAETFLADGDLTTGGPLCSS
jgi:pimeloyl-ACP methyl ester carboxylesterase